eukprot:COSAG02_NODE_8301_length_2625_cov_1.616390_3_plen_99_part_00
MWIRSIQRCKHVPETTEAAVGKRGAYCGRGALLTMPAEAELELMLPAFRPGQLDSSSSCCLSSAARISIAVGSADAGLFSFAASKSERTCEVSKQTKL